MTTKQNQPQEPTTSPLVRSKHPYHQVLKWVADGEEIQGLTKNDGWYDLEHNDVFAHCTEFGDKFYFQPNEFRIKPKPKPDVIGYCNVTSPLPTASSIFFGRCTDELIPTDNINVTFCGETLKLKAIEMIKEDSNDTI